MSVVPIEVAICTDGIFPQAVGGMQRHSRLLIEHIASDPTLNITVLHPHEREVFDPSLGIREITLIPIDQEKNYLNECSKYSRRMMDALDLINPDVVYSQGLSVWQGIENVADHMILHPHGLEPFQAISLYDRMVGLPFRRVFKSLFSKAEVTVSLGGKLTNILFPMVVDKGKLLVEIPNAIEVPEQVPTRDWDQELVNVLFVGRFAKNKGIDLLLSSIGKLNKRGMGTRFHFHLAGKGPLYDKFSTENNYENVTFHGFVHDDKLPELYTQAQVLVLPTLFEGMPTVILEAMAAGLPVIATNTGAIGQIVDSSNGMLIQRNSKSALFDALVKFGKLNGRIKEQMGHNSRRLAAEQFAWPEVAQDFVELFWEVSGRRR